jgi:hypothetical protein
VQLGADLTPEDLDEAETADEELAEDEEIDEEEEDDPLLLVDDEAEGTEV